MTAWFNIPSKLTHMISFLILFSLLLAPLAWQFAPAAAAGITTTNGGAAEYMVDQQGRIDHLQIILPEANLAVEVLATPSPAVAGEDLAFQVAVTNQGPSDATSVVVSNTLPVGVNYLGATADCSEASGIVTCSLGDLRVGEVTNFTIHVHLTANLVASQADGAIEITNTTQVGSNSATTRVLVQDLADLRVTQIIEPGEIALAGDDLTYTVYVDNLGPSYARSVRFSDAFSSSGQYQVVTVLDDPNRDDSCIITPGFGTHTQSTQINCTLTNPLEPVNNSVQPAPSPNTGRWKVSIVLRASTAVHITGVLDAFTQPSTPDNPYPGTPDPDNSNNQAITFIPVEATADLQSFSVFGAEVQTNSLPGTIIDTNSLPAMPEASCCNFGGTTVTAGRRIQWDTNVTNTGPANAQNARIQVYLPYGVSLIENTLSGIPNTGNVPGRCYTDPPGELRQTVTCEYGTLEVGETAALRFQVLVDPDLPSGTQLSFDSYTDSETFDTNLSNNLTSTQFDINTWADLSIQKYGNPSPVPAGTLTSYDLVVSHKGPSTARGVLLTDALPPGMTILSANVIDGLLTPVNCILRSGDPALVDSATCELGDLQPGASVRLVIEALVHPDANPGLITNTAFIDADTPDPFTSDNSATYNTTITTKADLEITKTGDPDKVPAGHQVKYTLKVENHGPSEAANVVITDELPVYLHYETGGLAMPAPPAEPPLAPELIVDCNQTASEPDVVTCSIGDLPAGETRSVEIWARIDPDAPTGIEVRNDASVASAVSDPDSTNNTSFARTYIMGVDLSLSKSAVGQILVNGQPFKGGLVNSLPQLDEPNQVTYGLLLSYTLSVENLGQTIAQNVVVNDYLPDGVIFQSIIPSQGRCRLGVAGNPTLPYSCNLGNIPGQGNATVIIIVRIPSDTLVGTVLYNEASVYNDLFDPNNSNDIDTNYTTVVEPTWLFFLSLVSS